MCVTHIHGQTSTKICAGPPLGLVLCHTLWPPCGGLAHTRAPLGPAGASPHSCPPLDHCRLLGAFLCFLRCACLSRCWGGPRRAHHHTHIASHSKPLCLSTHNTRPLEKQDLLCLLADWGWSDTPETRGRPSCAGPLPAMGPPWGGGPPHCFLLCHSFTAFCSVLCLPSALRGWPLVAAGAPLPQLPTPFSLPAEGIHPVCCDGPQPITNGPEEPWLRGGPGPGAQCIGRVGVSLRHTSTSLVSQPSSLLSRFAHTAARVYPCPYPAA